MCLSCSSAPAPEPSTPEPVQAPAARPGTLPRGEVVKHLDQGLGSFLQRVSVEPALDQGRFQGFRVISLQPPEFWSEVDLQPGDVITDVNGKSIEAPESAFEVFESLRTASELRVNFLRDGKARQLHFPIEGAPQPKAKG